MNMHREDTMFQCFSMGDSFKGDKKERRATRQAPMAVRHYPVVYWLYCASPEQRVLPAKMYLWSTSSMYYPSTWRMATSHPPRLIGPASSAGEEFPRFPHYWTRPSSSCLRLCLWVLLNIVDARLCLNQTLTQT